MATSSKTIAPGAAATFRVGSGTSAPELVTLAEGDVVTVTAGKSPVTPPPPPPPPVDPPPPPPPPVTGADWFRYAAALPTGAKHYTGSGSLGGFLTGLTAGQTGILDFDGEHAESITGFTIKDGVMVLPGKGMKPILNGDLKGAAGKGVRIYGLGNHTPGAASDDHVVDFKAGSDFEYGYAELWGAPCYTLLHPTGSLNHANFHHLYVHDNPGPHGSSNQDHGFYCSAPHDGQFNRIHHSLLVNFPHGRCVKVGGASGTTQIGGIRIDHNTMIDGKGPSDLQFSHGATNNVAEFNVFIGSGAAACVTVGDGCLGGNIVRNNRGDKRVVEGAPLVDGGGNVIMTRAQLMDFAANGAAGYGHLAP